MAPSPSAAEPVTVDRVQLGVRLEKRLVKVLKALAEYQDISLGQLLEDIILHAFEGESTFSQPEARRLIADLKRIYHVDYGVHGSAHFVEAE